MSAKAVVLDTNVFVAAGFNRQSASARILSLVRSGRLRIIWNEETRREARHILERIPLLSWSSVAQLFREEDRYQGETFPEKFAFIPDPDDRKFAALADASGTVLLTNDEHLLRDRDQARLEILAPCEFLNRIMSESDR